MRMNHPERLKKLAKLGVQGSPCRVFGDTPPPGRGRIALCPPAGKTGMRGRTCPSTVRDGNYSGARFPGNGKWAPLKDRNQGGKHGATLLAHGREITANGAKSRRPFDTAKGSRNFLLDG